MSLQIDYTGLKDKMIKLSRRDFLAVCTSASAMAIYPWRKPFPLRTAVQNQTPSVAVAEGTNDDSPEQIMQTALAGLGGIERFVKPGQTVAIKPNATWDSPPGTASSTHPEVLRALIQMVQEVAAEHAVEHAGPEGQVPDVGADEPGPGESARGERHLAGGVVQPDGGFAARAEVEQVSPLAASHLEEATRSAGTADQIRLGGREERARRLPAELRGVGVLEVGPLPGGEAVRRPAAGTRCGVAGHRNLSFRSATKNIFRSSQPW